MSYYQNHVGEDRALERIDEALQDNGIEEDLIIHCDEPAELECEASCGELAATEYYFSAFLKSEVTRHELTSFLLGAHIFVGDRKELEEELKWLRELLHKHEGH